MVDSAKGISNLHSPNDVIVDASMPAMIRAAARCTAPDGRRRTPRP
jgi:isocitrate dehydrogenase